MRSYPMDEWDNERLQRLNCAPWMLDLLKLNPEYPHWGPYEDYMADGGNGWNSRIVAESWEVFELKQLDELNEVVNFYFRIDRESQPCERCAGSGYHPDAQWVTESFYSHSSPFKRQTQSEIRAAAIMSQFGPSRDRLHEFGSYPNKETLARYGEPFRLFCEQMLKDGHWGDSLDEQDWAALKAAGRENVGALGHDAINVGILSEARCKRYGVPRTCNACDGHGHIHTAPGAHVGLVLWLIHPRKGASRGVDIRRVQESDLPAVFAFLASAATRNADRFAGVVARHGIELEVTEGT